VADSAVVHPGCTLEGAVIGERVEITRPILVRNSILLPNTRVEVEDDLEDCILSREIRIRCEPPGDRRAYAPR